MDKGNYNNNPKHPLPLRAVMAALTIALSLLNANSSRAAAISFSGGVPGTDQLQSDGTTPIPTDGSFQFELGSFGDFQPTTSNLDQWLSNWTPVTDPAGDPLAESTTDFTTLSIDFGGFPIFYEGYASTVELDHNNSPFQAGKQGYVWGFDTRDQPGDAQWILMTSSAWLFPDTTNALSNTWSVGNADTTYVGSITGGNQMTLETVTIPGAIPEPSSALLIGLASLSIPLSRRRPRHSR